MLCPSCAEKPHFRYYYLNRPPGIGCQPDGFVDRKTWMPGRVLNFGQREMVYHALGWVEYLEPLDPEQVWKWELWPHDDGEYEQYRAWRKENDR